MNQLAPLPIREVAARLDLDGSELTPWGEYAAKVSPDLLTRLKPRADAKYIVVSSMTPTPPGEGKTTTAIGLAMALERIGYRASVCLRQSSLGSVLNYRGGGAGGGLARLLPFDDVSLQLTGDHNAVVLAHNLIAALIDNALIHGNPLELDPFSVNWSRVIQVHDRSLRQVLTGLGGRDNGTPREARFESVAASEVMALLGLVNGDDECSARLDLRARLARLVVGRRRRGTPITAADLHAAGAAAVLLKDALAPNLVQTAEHTPAFVHTGPWGNLHHGSSSILADRIALKLSDYVVTEAAYGTDVGLEKFVDIKCRLSGLAPNLIVIVATLRALKMHGGVGKVQAGKPLGDDLYKENLHALDRGSANLLKHIENARLFGVPVVVAINRFSRDTDREIARVEQIAREAGAEGAYVSDVYERGGAGAIGLAQATVHTANKPIDFKPLYADSLSLKDKLERVVTRLYGGEGVEYSATAEDKLRTFSEWGYGDLPVCISKSHLSLSHEDKVKGRPRHFRLPVRDVRLAAGAGYVIALSSETRTMPGLPALPAAAALDFDEHGNVIGLD